MKKPLLHSLRSLSSVQEVISEQYFLHAIFKVSQGRGSFGRSFAVFHMKNSLFVETSRDPVILGAFSEVNNNKSVLDKFFVFCEFFVHNFAVEGDVSSSFSCCLFWGLSWCTGTRGNSYCFHIHTWSCDAVR